MKRNVMLTIASRLSILFMTFHLTDDIVRGMEPGACLRASRTISSRTVLSEVCPLTELSNPPSNSIQPSLKPSII